MQLYFLVLELNLTFPASSRWFTDSIFPEPVTRTCGLFLKTQKIPEGSLLAPVVLIIPVET